MLKDRMINERIKMSNIREIELDETDLDEIIQELESEISQ